MESHPILSLEDPPVSPPPQKNVFLGHFWLSERYTYLRTPMINQVLLSF